MFSREFREIFTKSIFTEPFWAATSDTRTKALLVSKLHNNVMEWRIKNSSRLISREEKVKKQRNDATRFYISKWRALRIWKVQSVKKTVPAKCPSLLKSGFKTLTQSIRLDESKAESTSYVIIKKLSHHVNKETLRSAFYSILQSYITYFWDCPKRNVSSSNESCENYAF